MSENTEKLLAALKSRREERVNLYKNLCSTENINALNPRDPFVYGHMLCSDLRNHLAKMNDIDLEIERAVCELLEERNE